MEKNLQQWYSVKLKRINVIGTSGCGKTTFSKKLAVILGCQYIEMDKIFWGPNWYWPTDDEFFSKLESALLADKWVLDGNYTRTLAIKWKNVDTVIWLDYSFSVVLVQAVKRAFSRAASQVELWEGTGNRESFKKSFFSKDSIILWTIKTFWKNREKYESYMSDKKFSHIKFIRLKTQVEAEKFLINLEGGEK